jgi:hypothetical protein
LRSASWHLLAAVLIGVLTSLAAPIAAELAASRSRIVPGTTKMRRNGRPGIRQLSLYCRN